MSRLHLSRGLLIAAATTFGVVDSMAIAQPLPISRLQIVTPPSSWRLTATGEFLPATDVSDANARGNSSRRASTSRQALRLGVPVWKRGLYRTVVANEFAFENTTLDLAGPALRVSPLIPQPASVGLRTLQHDLLVSQGLGPRWRISGVLQHGFFHSGSVSPAARNYRAAGGAFLSRTYRPSLQVGAGVLALNVSPWVIPTIRVLHVSKRTSTVRLRFATSALPAPP